MSFGRNGRGFVAINREGSAATTTYDSGMPEGSYCDVIHYDFLPESGRCVVPGTTTDAPAGDLIEVDAGGQIAGQELASARVWKGLADKVALGLGEELYVTIPRGRYNDLEAKVKLQPQLTAPLDAGVVVGRIDVDLGADRVASRDLLTLAAVEEAGFFGATWDGLKLWFGDLFSDEEEAEVDTSGDESAAEPAAEETAQDESSQ